MNDSENQVIIVTVEQIDRAVKGEVVQIVPARDGHQIRVDVNEAGLLTSEYVPTESKT